MPNNFRQHGNQSCIFGFHDPVVANIATAIGLKPQTASIQVEPEFTAEAKSENGMTDGVAIGDPKQTVTLSGFITDDDLFDGQGAAFTLNNRFFIVTGRKKDTSNVDFKKGEVTAVSYPMITSEDCRFPIADRRLRKLSRAPIWLELRTEQAAIRAAMWKDFQESFANTEHRVLGRRLRSFCLYYQFWLDTLDLPLLRGEPSSLAELELGTQHWCCRSGEAEGVLAPKVGRLGQNRWLLKTLRTRADRKFAAFGVHIRDWFAPPETRFKAPATEDRTIYQMFPPTLSLACALERTHLFESGGE